MKKLPFNKEKALAGAPVFTEGGSRVLDLIEFKSATSEYNLAGVVDGVIETFTDDGDYQAGGEPSELDLYMAGTSKMRYISVWRDKATGTAYVVPALWHSEKEARNPPNSDSEVIKVIPIDIGDGEC